MQTLLAELVLNSVLTVQIQLLEIRFSESVCLNAQAINLLTTQLEIASKLAQLFRTCSDKCQLKPVSIIAMPLKILGLII